jgi:hypothetical protein
MPKIKTTYADFSKGGPRAKLKGVKAVADGKGPIPKREGIFF